eukprot:CAMPEP_0171154656 /NCGR_PEP_ID=MMETSP0790-20130122/450_1 /TAXON_ID=2925 /ORGANISM="Alexandrium catenella, Strain OF101" /LENGTH=80 /DNA_ID=CAMNT_0011618757 /DNA_START=97 /DNA_END=339 /DNA_ORIENTATION=-
MSSERWYVPPDRTRYVPRRKLALLSTVTSSNKAGSALSLTDVTCSMDPLSVALLLAGAAETARKTQAPVRNHQTLEAMVA